MNRDTDQAVPRAVRTCAGRLQTAAHTWRRAEDGRVVTLVGAVHVADASYYRMLAAFIAEAQAGGALVHFEAVGRPEDAMSDHLVEGEREALKALEVVFSLLDRFGAVAGLVPQRDGLPRLGDWVKTDVEVLDLVRMLGPRSVVAMAGGEAADLLDDVADRRLVRWLARWTLRNLGHVHLLADRLGSSPLDKRMLLDWRNIVAAQAALAGPAGSHVVAIWGAAHLPGIGGLLGRNDFTLERVVWFDAIMPRRGRVAATGSPARDTAGA